MLRGKKARYVITSTVLPPLCKNMHSICTLRFTAALFTGAKMWKQPKCALIDEWISKIQSIHTTDIMRLNKEGRSDTCYKRMNTEGITLSELSQTRKDKYCMISLIRGTQSCQVHRESRTVFARDWGRGVGS